MAVAGGGPGDLAEIPPQPPRSPTGAGLAEVQSLRGYRSEPQRAKSGERENAPPSGLRFVGPKSRFNRRPAGSAGLELPNSSPTPAFLDKPATPHLNGATLGAVAQMGERCNRTAEVRGSIPLSSTT